MKLLGYFDDAIVLIYKVQLSLGWWNLLIIPLEIAGIFVIYFSIKRFDGGV